MISIIKEVITAVMVTAISAQLCCNTYRECAIDQMCDHTTQCYADPRFVHICQPLEDTTTAPETTTIEITTTRPIWPTTPCNPCEEIAILREEVDYLLEGEEKMKEEIQELHNSDAVIAKTLENNIEQVSKETAEELEKQQQRGEATARKLAGLAGWKTSGRLAYRCFEEKEDATRSAALCAKYGARLAAKALRDPAIVEDILSSPCKDSTWVGYVKIGGVWRWTDGLATNPETTAWAPGEPSNTQVQESCGEIVYGANGKILLGSAYCVAYRKYLCEADF